jgi:translocation and assembly module TamB
MAEIVIAPPPGQDRRQMDQHFLIGLVALLGAFLLWLNTDPGRRYIVRQINAFETVSGLKVHVGGIEGSVFSSVRLHDLRSPIRAAPLPRLVGRDRLSPFAYFRNHIDIRSLTISKGG